MALRQAEAGTAVEEICRKLAVSEQPFYRCSGSCTSCGTRIASRRGWSRTRP
jgi:hypothetical protein